MTNELQIDTHGPVLVLQMNRPQVRNAMNQALAQAMAEAIDAFEASPVLQVAVLTGAGGNFCAGMERRACSPSPRRPRWSPKGYGARQKPQSGYLPGEDF